MKIQSKYTDKKISPAQYLAEIMCERRAQQLEVDLVDNFWQSENWKKYFQYQVISANKLLKKFPIEIILKALNDKSCKKVSSINSPYLETVCKKTRIEVVQPTIVEERKYDSKGEFSNKKNALDRLDE